MTQTGTMAIWAVVNVVTVVIVVNGVTGVTVVTEVNVFTEVSVITASANCMFWHDPSIYQTRTLHHKNFYLS